MNRLFFCIRMLLLILPGLLLNGCASSPPTKFYLLSPVPASESGKETTAVPNPTTIRVDGVLIPGYLDRPEIVTRINENEIHLADLNQWGEPLRDNFTCVLAANLSRLLPLNRYAVFPFKSPGSVDYQVSVEILRMDGKLGGEVLLTAQWSVLTGENNQMLANRKSHLKASEGSNDYGSLVAVESRLLETLSREIAQSILALP